jgi:hypothetical protein
MLLLLLLLVVVLLQYELHCRLDPLLLLLQLRVRLRMRLLWQAWIAASCSVCRQQ